MEEKKSILHELYVFSEWKPEPEYIQKSDSILPENISAIWRWINFLGPKKSLIDSVTAHLEKQQKWHIALGDEGKVIAVLTDNILEIRTKRSEYSTIAARTTVSRDAYPQWRKLVWSPDCSFVVLAYGNGVVSFFDLTASNLFNIPIDCSRPGGLECTDNTHAVADIIFMPLRVKDTKWSWQVLVVTYDGKLRGYLVSQTDGCKLHHSFRFAGGVAALKYCDAHGILYVAGVPRGSSKEPLSSVRAGITAWRILNEEPYYKLSVVSGELDAHAAERFKLYVPFRYNNNLAFIVQMELSPDGTKLVCVHCNGDVSVWRLPVLKLLYRWPLSGQPHHDLRNPLSGDDKPGKKDLTLFYPADINWWSNEEIIVSRFSGAVTICDLDTMANILGKKPEFFQGTPQITCAHSGTFMVLEYESNVLPAKKSRSDDSMEVVNIESASGDSLLELATELLKTVLYAITDMESLQPRPRRITVRSRVYRLLGLRSTTPTELFNRKIESGHYIEALLLADTFGLDSDLVYQQQWRKNPVSTDAIQKYLSKVSKKIWAVHQCVDRLPETLPAAKELLQFGLELTNETILEEINKEQIDPLFDPDDILLEHLNAYTSELLRCRHVMLFYRERLKLYESILKCEKSTYIKHEYDRLRSNSVVYSAMEIAREGRIAALTCLWPHTRSAALQLAVLEQLPETISPLHYAHLLPTNRPFDWFDKCPDIVPLAAPEDDWCRKEAFRSIWSSNWSEDSTPEIETAGAIPTASDDLTKWYDKRARQIEERSGLISHAVTLISLASIGGGVEGLDDIMFHLQTLDVLTYDLNIEGVTLDQVQKMSILETCTTLMQLSTPRTIISDLKEYVMPFLKRCEKLSKRPDVCISGLIDYLESISINDLTCILVVLQAPKEFELDVRTHLDLVERCLFAHTGTHQLDKACDLLDTLLKEHDESISANELVRRVAEVERVVFGSTRLAWRGVRVPPRELRALADDPQLGYALLSKFARTLAVGEEKPTPQDWEKLLQDLLDLQSTVFHCITKDQCYEIYASALLTSGDAASVRLASEVLTCKADGRRTINRVSYQRSVALVSSAAMEYFNSASSLTDHALELAKCCLTLIKDSNAEIQKELDLIDSLQILHAFNVGVVPVQVRICEDKMTLIETCLMLDPNAYLSSHKLLKLAALLRIAGDCEEVREGQVLQLAAQYACAAGAEGGAGSGAGVELARRLAALHHAPAAPLLAHVARTAHAHADTATRRQLYAAALAYTQPDNIEHILRARMGLELESLQQMGVTLKENSGLCERWPSTDDEFADAVTTPLVEKKDLVPSKPEMKIPLFNYLLDTFQNKFALSDNKTASTESTERTIHCQEFYRSIYPEHGVSNNYYSYDRFSLPDAMDGRMTVGQNVLKWFYIQNCLEDGVTCELETEVVQKCAEEILYKDTPLSVACLMRATTECAHTRRLVDTHNTDAAVSCALYATLIKCHAAELQENSYFTKPAEMARDTLKQAKASPEQMELIRECIERLTGMGEVDALRALGYSVNGLLFNADDDYRQEIIYRVARSSDKQHVERACALAQKYNMNALDVWLQHAGAALGSSPPAHPATAPPLPPPARTHAAHARIKEVLWPQLRGTEHNALINYFALLKSVDEKAPIAGLTAAEHIKLLKKAKAASSELDYKLLLEQPSAEQLTAHILNIIRPENVGMVIKFLRGLPPAFKIPIPVNAIYTKWLTKYFFSVPHNATNKKWMQQYRQCASYFNKLAKHELLQFVADTCFTDTAIERVPAGTRNLMVMQAVDYCQQEQENDFKFNKNEQTWAQVGQELTRWARFLENFHSTTIQSLIDNTNVPRDQIWPEIEKSHGDPDALVSCIGRLVMSADVKLAALTTLLQCLHLDADLPAVLRHTLEHHLHTASDMETLVTRLTSYNKEGVKFPEELLEQVMLKAAEFSLPPHKQIGLLSLSQKARVHDSDDLLKIAQFTVDLFRTEWPDCDYVKDLTDDKLLSEEGRRDAFAKFLELSDTWQRKKALVDVLNCWPPTRNSDSKSLHSEYVSHLLNSSAELKENLVLIKLLLRRPVLAEEEVKWLADNVSGESVVNAIWVLLLSKCEHSKDDILDLVLRHKEYLQNQEIDDELIKELLDNNMFIKLVSSPLYTFFINYIITKEAVGEEAVANVYSVEWATSELVQAGYLAEAGHLRLMSIGVPTSLRGFSQTVTYCKNMLFN